MTNQPDHPLIKEQPRVSKLSQSPYVLTIVMAWGLTAYTLGANGVFSSSPQAPPISILIAAIGPAILFIAAYGVFSPLRRWVAALDLSEIIALQAWRIIGFAFIAVWGLGQLPAIFALPAGIGDIVVGMAAPAVALSVERRTQRWRVQAYALTMLGIVDFLAAFGTGILSRQDGPLHFDGTVTSHLLGVPPIGMFPAFIVPAFLLLHIIALIKLRRP